ncbi:hypothetical protein BGZ54_007952 [Gamsiella multidivaricata]|nr:hypothetical protein BGZ54_007952 [Gamsiella multidivaricata]
MSVRLDKTQTIVQHILRNISTPRRFPPGVNCTATKPLFVDDLYLPFKDQQALSQRYPDNKLIEFRGLPGTHDVQLGADTFRALCEANQLAPIRSSQSAEEPIQQPAPIRVPIPTYDKSLHSGRGDQAPKDQWPQAEAPFDVILFEGWSLGFKSIRDQSHLLSIYQQRSTFPPYYLAEHPFSSLKVVDQFLEAYEQEWYSYLDVFVHLSAPNLATVFKWRAEQERDLWVKKGAGMTEEQVKEFVSRFMPAYEVYLERLLQESLFKENETSSGTRSTGRHLRLDLDENRDIVSTTLVE